MCTVSISIPDEILFDKSMTADDATNLARQMTAVGLYARRNVSLGYCSDVAHMPKADFIKLLGRFGISVFHYDDDKEFDEELANAKGRI